MPEPDSPTDAQGLALARVMRSRPDARVEINRKPFDLPDGYLFVLLTNVMPGSQTSTFACGIAPDGQVSS